MDFSSISTQFVPVIVELMKTGKVIAIFYLIAITVMPIIKTLINWGFIYLIIKTFIRFFIFLYGGNYDEKTNKTNAKKA